MTMDYLGITLLGLAVSGRILTVVALVVIVGVFALWILSRRR